MQENNSTLNISFTDKLKIIPGFFGIRLSEEPQFSLVCSEGNMEIRKYSPSILASINIDGTFDKARLAATAALKDYIYGKNKSNKQIKVTPPFYHEESHEPLPFHSTFLHIPTHNGWTMSVVLPSNYTLASAPTPKDQRIKLHRKKERLIATIRYSGQNNFEKILDYSAKLIQWVSKSEIYIPKSDYQIAQYDLHNTLSFLRRNEIHMEIEKILI